jgi:hypothetical protein
MTYIIYHSVIDNKYTLLEYGKISSKDDIPVHMFYCIDKEQAIKKYNNYVKYGILDVL